MQGKHFWIQYVAVYIYSIRASFLLKVPTEVDWFEDGRYRIKNVGDFIHNSITTARQWLTTPSWNYLRSLHSTIQKFPAPRLLVIGFVVEKT